MNSPTPKTYVNDFMGYNAHSCTDLQKQQIWKENYAGRQISWPGTLYSCKEFSDSILVLVCVEVEDKYKTIALSLHLPLSEKQKLLSFHVNAYVRVTGVLKNCPDEAHSASYSSSTIDVEDARISHMLK